MGMTLPAASLMPASSASDSAAFVARVQVPVDLQSHRGIDVAQVPRHEQDVGAAVDEERRTRVSQVVPRDVCPEDARAATDGHAGALTPQRPTPHPGGSGHAGRITVEA